MDTEDPERLASELDSTRRLYRAACRELALLTSPTADRESMAITTEALRQERLRALDDVILELVSERNRLALVHGATFSRPLSELAPQSLQTIRDMERRVVGLKAQVPHPEALQQALDLASRAGVNVSELAIPSTIASRFFDAQIRFGVAESTIDELVLDALDNEDDWTWFADYYDASVDVYLGHDRSVTRLADRLLEAGFHVVRIHVGHTNRENQCSPECRVVGRAEVPPCRS